MRPVYDYERATADFDTRSFEAYLTGAGVEGSGHGMRRKYYCIWHDDKSTPNANLFDGGDGKVWLYCHACGEHGDIIDVAEALGDRALLSRYETDTPHRGTSRVRRSQPVNVVEGPSELTRKQWHAALDEAPYAITWLKRGISAETIKALELKVLDDGPHAGRLAVPYLDAEGEVVGLCSRAPNNTLEPRWRNEAGSKHILYWTPTALSAPRGATLVLTEGQSDAIAAFDCGFCAVGAPGSQSLTEAMAVSLRGYRVLVVGDGDEAGYKFSTEANTMLGDAFVERRVCNTPVGTDIGDLHRTDEARAWLSAQQSLPFVTPWKHLHRITATTQMSQERWLVDSWVPGQGVGCIYGESETFKSWLGCSLAQAVATGGTWLGHTTTETGPAVILDWENTQNDLVDRQRKLDIGDEVHWMHLPNGSLFDPEVLTEIALFLETIGPRFVFFDSLSRAFEDFEENSAAEANRVMATVMGLCSGVNAVGLVLHHVNKPSRGGGTDEGTSVYSVKNRMRGNTALVNAFQFAMYSQKGPMGQLYLSCAKQRSGIKPLPMEFMMRDTDQGRVSLDYVRTLKKPTP